MHPTTSILQIPSSVLCELYSWHFFKAPSIELLQPARAWRCALLSSARPSQNLAGGNMDSHRYRSIPIVTGTLFKKHGVYVLISVGF